MNSRRCLEGLVRGTRKRLSKSLVQARGPNQYWRRRTASQLPWIKEGWNVQYVCFEQETTSNYELWKTMRVDVLGLTEALQWPTYRFLIPLTYEEISLPPIGNRYRGNVCVAGYIQEGLTYKKYLKLASEKYQAFLIKIGDMMITADGNQYGYYRAPFNHLSARLNTAGDPGRSERPK